MILCSTICFTKIPFTNIYQSQRPLTSNVSNTFRIISYVLTIKNNTRSRTNKLALPCLCLKFPFLFSNSDGGSYSRITGHSSHLKSELNEGSQNYNLILYHIPEIEETDLNSSENAAYKIFVGKYNVPCINRE